MKAETKRFDYGVGALAVLAISVAVAAIVYGVAVLPLVFYNLPAWIFGPLGIYTLIYALVAAGESTYYLVWGAVMVAVAIVSALYNTVSPFLVIGILVIILAVIGVAAYMRSKK